MHAVCQTEEDNAPKIWFNFIAKNFYTLRTHLVIILFGKANEFVFTAIHVGSSTDENPNVNIWLSIF